MSAEDKCAIAKLEELARASDLDVAGGKIRRSSSRCCLGVEHGDYNGTELFGVGTDRFIWMAYKPNDTGRVRLLSGNIPKEGIIDFGLGEHPPPQSPEYVDSWGRFPFGVDHVLQRGGYPIERGFDAVLYGNIPGGGMSRSASLCLNLILTFFEVNSIEVEDAMRVIDLAQAVENDYIGSPCGKLDQIMIYFAREGMGTHYNPKDRSIAHVPLGSDAPDFRIVGLDTGTDRPGLEKSTYKVRREECDRFANMLAQEFGIQCLADVRDGNLYHRIESRYRTVEPDLCDRLDYIYHAQARFYKMLDAWKAGEIDKVGKIFREDGIGLRDKYRISGPELESMCDIARTVAGVFGERMLGGGDKGAAGAIVSAAAVADLEQAVNTAYPRSHPEQSERYAIHPCRIVDGIKVLSGL